MQGIQTVSVEHVDLTLPFAKMQKIEGMCDELAIIGSPVYGGRLPIDFISRLRRLKGNDAPAVIIVMYGNRAYKDSLLELREGFKPIAAGAFMQSSSLKSDIIVFSRARKGYIKS